MLSVKAERALFLESHRNCFGWIDEWFGLTLEVMQELEQQSDCSLNKVKMIVYKHLLTLERQVSYSFHSESFKWPETRKVLFNRQQSDGPRRISSRWWEGISPRSPLNPMMPWGSAAHIITLKFNCLLYLIGGLWFIRRPLCIVSLKIYPLKNL